MYHIYSLFYQNDTHILLLQTSVQTRDKKRRRYFRRRFLSYLLFILLLYCCAVRSSIAGFIHRFNFAFQAKQTFRVCAFENTDAVSSPHLRFVGLVKHFRFPFDEHPLFGLRISFYVAEYAENGFRTRTSHPHKGFRIFIFIEKDDTEPAFTAL